MQVAMTAHWREVTPPLHLSDDEAHVWAVAIDEHGTTAGQQLVFLSHEERMRAKQFQLEAPRRRFIVSRAALRRLLGAYLDMPAADISLAYSPRGKPQLGGTVTAWPWQFNVAHTHDLALVALTRGCDIGVDVERRRAVSHLESIVRRYFHPAEISEILAAPANSRHEAFLRCWTAKEAVIKATDTGLSDSLAEFYVPVAGSGGAWVDMSILANGTPQRCWLEGLCPSEESIAAVAFVGQRRRVSCFTLPSHPRDVGTTTG
jgi:4'-phosphopantetheinyl transferase